MTQQLDMIPTPIAEDAAVLARIAALPPKARLVKSRLPQLFAMDLRSVVNTTGAVCHVERHDEVPA